jgi:hypothetical protein
MSKTKRKKTTGKSSLQKPKKSSYFFGSLKRRPESTKENLVVYGQPDYEGLGTLIASIPT